jgi:GxxExxY protein
MDDTSMDPDLPHRVLAAALEVHKHLGPGLTRDAYEECLCIELRELEVSFLRGEKLRFEYRGKQVEDAARIDVLVEGALVVQVVAREEITPLELAGLETLLRLGGYREGMLVNFAVTVLRKGVHRVTLKRRAAGVEDSD